MANEVTPSMIWAAVTLLVLLLAVVADARRRSMTVSRMTRASVLGLHGVAELTNGTLHAHLANGERYPARTEDGTPAALAGDRVVVTGFAHQVALVVVAPPHRDDAPPRDTDREGSHATPQL